MDDNAPREDTPPTPLKPARTALNVLALCFALSVLGRGLGESFTVFLKPISESFGWDRAQVVSVYSLAALSGGLAAPLIAVDDSTHVVAAIDARHDHVYLQIFGTGGRTLVAPRIATLRDALRAAITGPSRVIGSGASLLARAWPKDTEPPLLVDPRTAPDISWIARLGAAAAEGYGPPKPLYLRAPDAQPQDAAHLPRR